MPRPRSPLWEHFHKELSSKRAICQYCDANLCGLVTRMRTHLARKCPNCPAPLKAEMLAEIDKLKHDAPASNARQAKKPRTDTSATVSATATVQVPTQATVPVNQKTSTSPSVHSSSTGDKSDLDSYVARAIFGAGLPVATVENPSFIRLLKRMSPSYDPPSAFVLSTAVLDVEYLNMQLNLRAEVLDATVVSLGVELWARKRLLVGCVMNTPSPVVLGFESTGDTTHTFVDKIENIMNQVGTGRVSVIVTDTLKSESMKQASLALRNKYPAITFLPSCAHTMTAMMTEMLAQPVIASTLDTCKQLARFFAQDHVARSAIARVSEQIQFEEVGASMGDPDDTSLIGMVECLCTLERNRHSLDNLVAENNILNNLSASVKEQIISIAFWEKVSAITSLFEPFLEMLKMFESDCPLLSTFYHRFSLLWGNLEKCGSLASMFEDIMSRYRQSIQHPAMYTAYLLDPRFPPSSLSGEATSEALAYIKRTSNAEQYGSIVDELTRFTARTGIFADDAIWEFAQKCSPIHWWKGFIGSSCPNLQSVALRALSLPASSGLSNSKREMFEKIQAMNTKYMYVEQASKATVVFLNSNLSSSVEEVAANETIA